MAFGIVFLSVSRTIPMYAATFAPETTRIQRNLVLKSLSSSMCRTSTTVLREEGWTEGWKSFTWIHRKHQNIMYTTAKKINTHIHLKDRKYQLRNYGRVSF